MEVVLPSYKILTRLDGTAILKRLEVIARVCYKSEDKITEDSCFEFIRKIIKRGHTAMIEHESVTVHFTMDRGVSHELVRHRLAAYAQESTRYCDYGNGHIKYIKPLCTEVVPGIYTSDTIPRGLCQNDIYWVSAMLSSEWHYQHLRKGGWAAQYARDVLPVSLKTEIVSTYNLREWRHVFNLRTAHAAHPQIRELMVPLFHEMREKIPAIFDDMDVPDELEEKVKTYTLSCLPVSSQ